MTKTVVISFKDNKTYFLVEDVTIIVERVHSLTETAGWPRYEVVGATVEERDD